MLKQIIGLSLILTGMASGHAEKLTIERIFASPSLSGTSPRNLKISPDGERVTFLKGKQSDFERLDLWEYHIASGKTRLLFDSDKLHQGDEALSDEEKARRERMRLSGTGIVEYSWSNDGQALLFPLAGDAYYHKIGDTGAVKLLDTPEFETDIQFSPDGNYIAFIRSQNLFIKHIESAKETQLTTDGANTIKNGMAEFVAQEEMGRLTGYWWAGDESKIAYLRVDESPVEKVTRSEIYAEDIKLIQQRYPYAGTPNVTPKLGVVSVKTKQTQWVNIGENPDIYIPRVKWTKDSNLLTYQKQNRLQNKLELNLVDLSAKKTKNLVTESSDTWINLHDDLRFLNDRKSFIWASERDGFKHFYLYSIDGKLRQQLTKGSWVTTGLKAIDDEKGIIYFTGRADTPLENHLYQTSLDGTGFKKITTRAGVHNISFSKNATAYVDSFRSIKNPTQVSLHNNSGKHLAWLAENKIDKNHPLQPYMSDWIYPELSSFKNEDGVELFYRLYKPANFNPKNKYPVMVFLYGGPRAQLVTNSWDRLFNQYMAQQGYVVFTVDNRGSYNRGKAFEDPLYLNMGDVEVRDQVSGVKFLRKLPFVNPQKIGVYGHSYGGYMALLTMFKAPDYFQAGVSGAPVTDWSLYDTHYTERYMGLPQKNIKGYEASAVFPYVENLKGELFIYHGMADDNVLFKNSTKLYKQLQDKSIPFWSMDYPGKKHSIRGQATRVHQFTMIKKFFDQSFNLD